MHEVKELERLFSQLEQYGLSIDDYFLTRRNRSAVRSWPHDTLGQRAADDGSPRNLADSQLDPHHRQSGDRDQALQGLGEMNSEELWETRSTRPPDPPARDLEEAGEAERMFSVLMARTSNAADSTSKITRWK